MTTVVCPYCQELAEGDVDFIKSLPLEPFTFSGWYQMYAQSTSFMASQDRWPAEENTPGVAQAKALALQESLVWKSGWQISYTLCVGFSLGLLVGGLVWLLGSQSQLLAWSSVCRPGWCRFGSVCSLCRGKQLRALIDQGKFCPFYWKLESWKICACTENFLIL